MNKKETMKTVGKYLKSGCKIAAYGAATILSYLSLSDIKQYVRDVSIDVNADYGDAVNAIMSSNMWSEDKKEAVQALSKGESAAFYKAVIKIANSNMWSADKAETIMEMCKPE